MARACQVPPGRKLLMKSYHFYKDLIIRQFVAESTLAHLQKAVRSKSLILEFKQEIQVNKSFQN